jgi:hypothetical protein
MAQAMDSTGVSAAAYAITNQYCRSVRTATAVFEPCSFLIPT